MNISFTHMYQCTPIWRWFYHRWDFSLGWEAVGIEDRKRGYRICGIEFEFVYHRKMSGTF